MSTLEKLLMPRAAAEHLGLCIHSLALMRSKGTGPNFVKIGRRVAYRESALADWIKSREFTSTSEARRAGVK